MINGDRLTTVGGVVAGLGAALGVAYFIYSLEARQTFWSSPGWLSVAVTGIGMVILVVGLFHRDKGPIAQRQRGGRASKNYQAGRDLTIGKDDSGDR